MVPGVRAGGQPINDAVGTGKWIVGADWSQILEDVVAGRNSLRRPEGAATFRVRAIVRAALCSCTIALVTVGTQQCRSSAAGSTSGEPKTGTQTAPKKSGGRFDPAHLRQLLETRACYLCDLQEAPLAKKNLRGADLQRADLRNADLTGADLSEAQLLSADVSGAHFRGAILREANFLNTRANRADFTGANFRGAQLLNASLEGADLTNADFSEAGLRGANLTGARTQGIRLQGAQFKETTLPDGTNCSEECTTRIPQ